MNTSDIWIDRELYEQLVRDSAFLDALRDAGVDNWYGYDYAQQLFEEQSED